MSDACEMESVAAKVQQLVKKAIMPCDRVIVAKKQVEIAVSVLIDHAL